VSEAGHIEIATVVATALCFGLLLRWIKQPPLVGYILAGITLGPSGFALVTNRDAVAILAEMGVLLLLFVIGMEMSLRGFRRVARVAVGVAALQISVALISMYLLGQALGWPAGQIVLFGFILAISSTAVAMKLLEDIGELRTEVGRIAIGVLIAQDLAVIPMVLVIRGMGEASSGLVWLVAAKIIIAVALLAFMVRYLTKREKVSVPFEKIAESNVEIAALIAIGLCFCFALFSHLIGLSSAFGAFLAGLWIGNSTARSTLLNATLPIQGVLIMVLFLSFGLLIDLDFVWSRLGTVLALLVIATIIKSALNIFFMRALGEPWPRAWLAGMTTSQIGEFSFVLLATGAASGIINENGQKLAMAVIALSLMTSPFWLFSARRLETMPWQRIFSSGEVFALLYGRELLAISQFTKWLRRIMPGRKRTQAEDQSRQPPDSVVSPDKKT